MILTEKEASGKWCVLSGGTEDTATCGGSRCMAWRWKDETCSANGIGWKGYCGLAGRPEPMEKE